MMPTADVCELCVFAPAEDDRARALADKLRIPLVSSADALPCARLFLTYTASGLALSDGKLSLTVDFAASLARLRRGNLRSELLVRAATGREKIEHPTLLDATAGLGEDALLFAAAGFSVSMYEADPMIAALLADGLARARADAALADAVGRMHLTAGDSISAMRALKTPPDVVYLDPMFPRRQKSGLVKKKFQLLQQRQPPCTDEDALLGAALACGARRIIIKRPKDAPPLCGRKPSYSLCGSSIRCDCIVR